MSHSPIRISLILACTLGISCAQDTLELACKEESSALDIAVSELEDAMTAAQTHDAIILEYNSENLDDNDSWRVNSVDIMVMLPATQFSDYNKTPTMAVEVFDADNPLQTKPYVLTQKLVKEDLEWHQVTLSNTQESPETHQWYAWWNFDLSKMIPESGMTSSTFLVSVFWPEPDSPALGYSKYTRACDKNWTQQTEFTGWIHNSERSNFLGQPLPNNSCNWPMLRVNVEVTKRGRSCH